MIENINRRCIVLAGGLGTRLQSVIGPLPKCLAPVGSRPFLCLQLDWLAKAGITEVGLSLGHGASQVLNTINSLSHPLRILHVVENKPLGTGGAIAYAMDELGWPETLVVNGDTLIEADISALLKPLRSTELCRIGTCEVADCARFGSLALGLGGRVERFLEKGIVGPGLINAGIYSLQRAALSSPRQSPSFEHDVLPALAERGALWAVSLRGEFFDIGVPSDYYRFLRERS